MASAIHRSFEFSLIHRMYYPSLLLLIKDKKCASSISSIKESKYYIQRKTSVDRVILQSFVEQNSCSALMSSSQLIKKCHSYYSISILILKIYHIIVKMIISTWNHTHTEICIFRSFGWKHNFKVSILTHTENRLQQKKGEKPARGASLLKSKSKSKNVRKPSIFRLWLWL